MIICSYTQIPSKPWEKGDWFKCKEKATNFFKVFPKGAYRARCEEHSFGVENFTVVSEDEYKTSEVLEA